MATISPEELITQMNRRKRVKRMKNTIILVFVSWLCISIIICGVLIFRSIRTDTKINSLVKNMNLLNDKLNNINFNNQNSGIDKDVSSTIDEYSDWAVNYQGSTDNEYEAGDEREVYLTFDDGPSDNTALILDVLKRFNVKATFFVTGKTDEHSKEMYQRIVDEGHTIGLHSYSHKYSEIYASKEAFMLDLKKISDLIFDVTGQRSMVYRFPGGSSNQVSNVSIEELIQALTENGYTYYDWNVMSGDASNENFNADLLTQNVMSGITKNKTSMVLYHDANTRKATVESIKTVIENLINMEAKILPIDDKTQKIQHVRVPNE